MINLEDIRVELLDYGPRVSLRLGDGVVEVEPDILIALEGIGTIEGVTLGERYRDLLSRGKDPGEVALRLHRESTRRGHASLTTSLTIQIEVNKCSRACSMVLVAPPFGSYLQESQRRRMITKGDFVIPRRIASNTESRKLFERAIDESYNTYRLLIEFGVGIEDARYILPLASATSLFASGSLDTFLGFIIDSERLGGDSEVYPEELAFIGDKIKEIALKIAPMLTRARLSFKSRLPTYPYSNPYKAGDPIIKEVLERVGHVSKPRMLSLTALVDYGDALSAAMQEPATASTLMPLINAVFLEPLSLVAYHQSIRHRTVPTAVESIYEAAERLVDDPDRNLIIPPRVSGSENALKLFRDSAGVLTECYQRLIESGVPRSDSIYLVPQAMRIYVIRAYNAFNLLWPQGYVATRTCSYSQWEERKIAYEVWKRVAEADPELGSMMGERCKLLGYCPEGKWCPIILKYREYNDDIHRKVLGEFDSA